MCLSGVYMQTHSHPAHSLWPQTVLPHPVFAVYMMLAGAGRVAPVPSGHRTRCRMRLTLAMVHSATCQINGGVTIRAWYEDGGDASNYDVSDGRRHCHVIYAKARAWSIAELTVATRWGGSSSLARAGAAAADDNEHVARAGATASGI